LYDDLINIIIDFDPLEFEKTHNYDLKKVCFEIDHSHFYRIPGHPKSEYERELKWWKMYSLCDGNYVDIIIDKNIKAGKINALPSRYFFEKLFENNKRHDFFPDFDHARVCLDLYLNGYYF